MYFHELYRVSNGPSTIIQRLSSENFTRSIPEYFAPYQLHCNRVRIVQSGLRFFRSKIYKKQRNYVLGLNKQATFECFSNLDCKKDTKPFWDKCKPYFSNKHRIRDTNIMLKEKRNSSKKLCSS